MCHCCQNRYSPDQKLVKKSPAKKRIIENQVFVMIMQTLLFKPYIFNSLSFIFISIHVCLKKNAVFKLNVSMKFTEYLFKDLSELFMYVTCISI